MYVIASKEGFRWLRSGSEFALENYWSRSLYRKGSCFGYWKIVL